jgi:signal transduction histidine kinase
MKKTETLPLTRMRKQVARPRLQSEGGRIREPYQVDPMDSAIARVALERSRAGKALQDLTGKLLEAQEEERRRIGRELHDGLNQQLAMFAVELGLLARQVPAKLPDLQESILNLRHRAEGLSNDLRLITHQLHPAALEHLGLISALRSLCGEFSRYEGVRVWFSVEKEIGQVPSEIAICLYRIAQEALRNVVKHSGSNVSWVRITESRDEIQLSIEDRGVGFKLHNSPTAGLGLVSMQERVQIVQGKINIQSAPDEGTFIRVFVPITWKEQKSGHEKKASKAHAAAG